jgi:hypothetical protein
MFYIYCYCLMEKNKQHSSITGVTYLLSIENEGWNYNQFDL